jgi:hypothetical protein
MNTGKKGDGGNVRKVRGGGVMTEIEEKATT